jgi:predicted ATP-binding protein involved in virulence
MRITKIHLQNIGAFEDETIGFLEKTISDRAEIHILTGENGTGKSTILYALASIQEVHVDLKNRFRFSDERSLFRLSLDNGSELKYSYSNAGYLSLTTDRKSPLYSSYIHKINNYQITNFEFAFFAYSGYRNIASTQIGPIQELTVNPFENSLDFKQSVNPSLFMQWVANNKTKEALELIKNGKGNADRYRKSVTRIENAIAEIINQKIEFVLETDPLNVVIKVEDKILSFDVLPDGLKSIISWIADLLMRMDRIKWTTDVEVLDRNFVLFLDEIDVHLHPAWQRKILPAVQKLFKNAQIFVSTHSPFVVGSVDGAWIHKLVLDGKGNSRAQTPKLSEDGESYQLILKEVFDIEKRFGLETEADLDQFNRLKTGILQKQPVDKPAFLQLARHLAEQSIELSTIIGSELRQLSRITQEEFAI